MKESKRQTMNFRLPVVVLTALRKRAKRDRVSMTTIVEAALRNFLGVPSYLQRHGRITDSGTRQVQITRKGGKP